MLYHAYQAHRGLFDPLQLTASATAQAFALACRAVGDSPLLREAGAAFEVFARLRLTHERPDFGVTSVTVDGRDVPLVEQVVHATPFADLRRFARADGSADALPKVLIVAPLSGHFATLLRDTVRTMLADHDCYITDWHNARHVPLVAGRFGLDEYVDHLIDFLAVLGERPHVVAICQPCVAALAAVALMAEDRHPALPASLTLMAGPVDARVNPTAVNVLATGRPIAWFEKNLISRVPLPHAGAWRRVYPGFLQLVAFMSMNPDRHLKAFAELRDLLGKGELGKADGIRAFYAEYFAVNDLPAEFYLETVERVFQTFDLARGVLSHRDRRVDPAAIRTTALLTVEGERDDICAIGQTVAAQDLCSRIKPYLKNHHVQTGVGHYGVFSGRRWQQQIYPRVRALIQSSG